MPVEVNVYAPDPREDVATHCVGGDGIGCGDAPAGYGQ
jgi:hypothetical protein